MFESLKAQFMSSGMVRWYQSQSARERLALNLLGGFLLAALFYLAVWQPIHDWQMASERAFARQHALLEWMHANEEAARRAGGARQSSRGTGSLLGLVASTARSHDITLSRYQPEGDDGVSVTLNEESFDAIIVWLDELNRSQGVSVRRLTVNRRNDPGRITAQLLLAR